MPTGFSYMGGMSGTAKSSGKRGRGRKPRNGRTPRSAVATKEKALGSPRLRRVRST